MRSKFMIGVGAVAVVMLLSVAAQPAHALCTAGRTFLSQDQGNTYVYTDGIWPGTYPDYYTQPTPSTSGALKGTFWSLSTTCTDGQPSCGGNPASGVGNDSGALSGANALGQWLRYYATTGGSFYATYISGQWGAAGVDNCIDLDGNDAALADDDQCMVILLEDECPAGGTCFAVVSANSSGGNYSFSQQIGGGGTAADQIVLRPVPKPRITGSFRVDDFNVELQVGLENVPSDPAGGIYPGCGDLALTGYRIFSQNVGRGAPAPADRNVNNGLWQFQAAGGPTDSVQVDASCSGDEDVYLATTLTFDSGYELTLVSDNATTVQCGPTLVDDPIQQIKPPSRRKLETSRPRGDRGSRR